jgi:hemolysin III
MEIKVKDPGSFLTHYIAMLGAMIMMVPLLCRVMRDPSPLRLSAFIIFAVSIVLLYGASSTYHFFDISTRVNRVLRKIDHMMIFVMIMGSYTPICLVAMGGAPGLRLLLTVYGISAAGMLMNAFWINCPKWLSSAIYIALGWVCVFSFGRIFHALSLPEFVLLAAGGVIYTLGGVIYALKLPLLTRTYRFFGNHEIFHLFVVAGTACHYSMMLLIA